MRKPVTRTKPAAKKAVAPPVTKPAHKASYTALSQFLGYVQEQKRSSPPPRSPFELPTYAPGVLPSGMAMDDVFGSSVVSTWEWANANGWSGLGGAYNEGLWFMGYPYLAEISQRSEYRVPCEVIAEEMTRKWITIKAETRQKSGENPDPDKLDKVAKLNDAMEKFKVRDVFRHAMELDGIFGLSFVYLDLMLSKNRAAYESDEELKTPLLIDKGKIAKGSLRGFKVLDPTWMAALDYDSRNPLDPTFYKPQIWSVMARRIHHTRLLSFCSRPVPDLIKPAYNFGGISLLQMMKPYVDNWLSTRQSVNDLIQAFTTWNLRTNMSAILEGGSGQDMDLRLQLFSLMKSNRGVMATDMETEELTNISAPLGTLDHLQAQAQEHMCLDGATLVTTARGNVPIRDVTVNDWVLTRQGYAPVKWSGVTKHTEQLIEIEADGKVLLRATPEHPIWSETKQDFVPARNVSLSHRLLRLQSAVNTVKPLHGVVAYGGLPGKVTTGTRKLAASYIASCGKHIAGQFRRIMKSTTSMVTGFTTPSIISNWSLATSTGRDISNSALSSKRRSTLDRATFAARITKAVSTTIGLSIAPKLAVHGLLSFEPAGCHSKHIALNAKTAERTIRQGEIQNLVRRLLVSAPPNAYSGPTWRASEEEQNHPTTLSARSVSKVLQPSEFRPGSVLPDAISVAVSRASELKVLCQPVYDIQVDGPPEFFANGILVHNSAPARIPLVKLFGITPSGLNACLTGETLISTDRGQIPIRDVTVLDKVMTREGFAPLTFSGVTKYATDLVEVRTVDAVIRCTSNHPIWISSINAFVPAEDVQVGDRLLLIGEKVGIPKTLRQWLGVDNGGGKGETGTTQPGTNKPSVLSSSIGVFGKRIANRFPKAFIFTTRIATEKTIKSSISSRCTRLFMQSITRLIYELNRQRVQNLSFAHTVGLGLSLQDFQAENGFVHTNASKRTEGQTDRRRQSRNLFVHVKRAEYLSRRSEEMLSSVLANVRQLAKTARRTCTRIILSTLKSSTDHVLSVRRVPASEPVYDLTVAPGHLPEFFANGILTHNSTDGEIRTFYDTIHATQEKVFQTPIQIVLDILQLNEFGEIDPDIRAEFNPLWELDEAGEATVRKTDSDNDIVLVNGGIISPEESRERLAKNPKSGYYGLQGAPPEPPDLGMGEDPGANGGDEPQAFHAPRNKDPGSGKNGVADAALDETDYSRKSWWEQKPDEDDEIGVKLRRRRNKRLLVAESPEDEDDEADESEGGEGGEE